MANIELNVVALGDFKPLEASLKSLQAQINSMNATLGKTGQVLSKQQLSQLGSAFSKTMTSTGAFTSKVVSLSSAAEHLGQRLAKGRATLADFGQATKSVSNSTNLYNQLAQRQVALTNSIVYTMGGGMAKVFASHKVDLTNSTLRTEVYTKALIAQNAAMKQAATGVINWGKNTQWAGRQLTYGLAMPLTMIAAGTASVFKTVDENLTRLAKVYGVGLAKPTQSMLDSIRKDVLGLAKELGHELGISSVEVSDIAAQFAAAGMTGSQLISATKQAARMVVLGETDKQEAIKATIALQTAYKLNNEQLTESVNFFNAAQAATSTSMADLIEAVPRVGPVIRGLGGSYKDMVAILTALKEGGVPAGEAANAIKTSMGRLINPTKAAEDRLSGFGINIKGIVTANAGNLVGMLTTLQKELDKLAPLDRQRAIAELFGKFQFARMSALMDNFNKTGTQSAKVVEMMGMSAGELAGIADEQTKKIQQSASGQFKIAIQDIKNALIPFGEASLKIFNSILQNVKSFIDAINDAPKPIKTLLKLLLGLTIVVGPVIMITGLLGNLVGYFMKAGSNFITFFNAIRNGINPLSVLGRHFQHITEESTVAARAEEIFGKENISVAESAKIANQAIEEQIALLKQLENQLRSVSATKTTTTAATTVPMVGPVPPVAPGAKQSRFFNSQVANVGGTGQATTVDRRAVSGTLMIDSSLKSAQSQGAFKNTELMYSNPAEKSALLKQGKSIGLSTAQTEQLIISREKMIELEARHIAGLQMLTSSESEFVSKYKILQEEYITALSGAGKSASKVRAVNEEHQLKINALFEQEEEFKRLTLQQIERQNAALAKGASTTEVFANNLQIATNESRRIYSTIPALNDAMDRTGWTIRAAAQRFSTGTTTMLRMVNKGFGKVERSHVVASSALDGYIVKIEEATGATAKLTTSTEKEVLSKKNMFLGEKKLSGILQKEGINRQTRLGIFKALTAEQIAAVDKVIVAEGKDGIITYELINAKGKLIAALQASALREEENAARPPVGGMGRGGKIAMGVGMAAGMGSMMVGMDSALGMGLMGASMGSMFGNKGLAIGVTLGVIAGKFKDISQAAKDAGDAIKASMTSGSLEVEMLGAKVSEIGKVSFPEAAAASEDGKTAVDRFSESIRGLGADDPLSKLVESIKGADIQGALQQAQQKYLTLRIQGVNDADARNFVRAILRVANKESVAGRSFDEMAVANKNLSTPKMLAEAIKLGLTQQNNKGSLVSGQQAMFNGLVGATSAGAVGAGIGTAVGATGGSVVPIAGTAIGAGLGSSIGAVTGAGVGFLAGSGITETKNQIDEMTSALNKFVNTDMSGLGNKIFKMSPGFKTLKANIEANSQALNDLMQNTDPTKMISTLAQVQASMDADSQSTLMFDASVKQLYATMGGSAYFDEFQRKGWETAGMLLAIKAVNDGVIADLNTALALGEDKLKKYYAKMAPKLSKSTKSANDAANAAAKEAKAITDGNNALTEKIKNLQDLIDALKKEKELRDKIAQREKESLEYEKNKLSLRNKIREALASGNILAATEAQQALTTADAERKTTLFNQRQDDITQAKIDELERQKGILEGQKKTAPTTTTSPSSGPGTSGAVSDTGITPLKLDYKLPDPPLSLWGKIKKGFGDAWAKVRRGWDITYDWFFRGWHNFTAMWSRNVSGPVSRAWGSALTWIQTKWSNFTSWISEKWNSFTAMWSEKVTGPISRAWDRFVEDIKGIGKTFVAIGMVIGDLAYKYIITPIKNKWNEFTGWFGEHVTQPIKDWWQSVVDWFDGHVIQPIKNKWNSITTWFDTNIIQPIKTWWKSIPDWFEEHITNPIKGFWKSISDWFDANVIQPIKDKWATISAWFDQNVIQPVKDTWASISGWVETHVIQPVKDKFTELLGKWDVWKKLSPEEMKVKIEEWLASIPVKIEEMKTKFLTKWEEIKTSVIGKFNEIGDWFSDLPAKVTAMKTKFLEKWEEIKQSVIGKFNEIGDWFSDLPSKITEIKTKFLEKWETLKTETLGKLKGIFTGLHTWMFGEGGWFTQLKAKFDFDSILASLKKPWNELKTYIKDHIVTPVKNMFSGIAGSVGTALKNAWNAVAESWNGTVGKLHIHVMGTNYSFDGPKMPTFAAEGGYISGPGSWTSDSIPAMLSNGEFVIKASAVSKYGIPMLESINAGRYSMGGLVSMYSTGGYVVPNSPAMADGGSVSSNTVNATFNISGPDANEVVKIAMRELQNITKSTGAVTRIGF